MKLLWRSMLDNKTKPNNSQWHWWQLIWQVCLTLWSEKYSLELPKEKNKMHVCSGSGTCTLSQKSLTKSRG
eukprot:12902300-Prorocentrum_lima.AAC.1